MTRFLPLALALVAVIASAIAVVERKHESRRLFVELQDLERERDRLEVEWGRLRLEQGTFATHARVEGLAREELGLLMPRGSETIIINRVTGAPGDSLRSDR